MTTIPTTALTARSSRSLPRLTAIAAVAGAAVTTAAAGIVHAAGVSLSAGGEIPLSGFATVTLVAAVLGGVLLAGIRRFSASPRRRFLQVTGTLTALSLVFPLAMAGGVGSATALVVLHLVAAGVIIPVLAARLGR